MKQRRHHTFLQLLCFAAAILAITFTVRTAGLQAQDSSGSSQKQAQGQKQAAAKGDPAKGKQVFDASCAICHIPDSSDTLVGPGLKGLFSWPPHKLSDGTPRDKETVETVRQQITQGGGAMAPVGAGLSEDDLNNLIAYLQTL